MAKPKDEIEAKPKAPEAVEVMPPTPPVPKQVSFDETILTEGKSQPVDPALPLANPEFQALMRKECEFREASGLPVDEGVLSAVRSRWANLKAAKQAKA